MDPSPPELVHGTIEATINRTSPYTFDDSAGGKGWLGHTSLHVAVSLDQAPPIARTADVRQNTMDGTKWNERIHGHCAHRAQEVIFSITVRDSQEVVGYACLSVTQLFQATGDERELPVLDASGQALFDDPIIYLGVKFHGPAALASEVPRTYFPQRPGSRVTLYQDAHCLEPRGVELPDGGHYQRGLCWDDVFDAIDKAKHLVYIAGWSVNTSTKLVRRHRDGKEAAQQETLGDLLKRKAREKVRVLLLVWNDMGSVRLPLPFFPDKYFEIPELCQSTHDKETMAYFKKTGVHCVLVYRLKLGKTHHQKMIIVDHAVPGAAAESDPRQIVSFVGGLDLCDGRYDTQEHCLFRTLDEEDFHQVSIEGASFDKGGPRTPWHDIHCKIEGPAAWDVLKTFEQRWRKQGNGEKLLVNVRTDSQLKIVQSTEPVVNPQDKEAWNVQVFRSIDSTSVVGFPEPKDASERHPPADSLQRPRPRERNRPTRRQAGPVTHPKGLVCGHNDRVIERSVQDAYIHAIRRANNFIYIENQYLIGGAFQWESERDCAAQNLVARELSLKIASKIKANQPFAVYVVLPMWPEGIPHNCQVQQILYWQRLTMEMMYRDVAAALKAAGKEEKDVKPEEHVLFFCLGNREPNESNGERAGAAPDGTPYGRAQKARRFMIYVHSKMMIVDDDYIIVGSANINQRSMDGTWDTEISMGACQPHYNSQADAKGQVFGFRMSLWYEHLGCSKDDPAARLLLNPGEPSCVQQVKKWAQANWDTYYAEEEPRALPHGHLLPYPIQVDSEGSVTHRVKCFPDTQAPVLGARGESWKAELLARRGES